MANKRKILVTSALPYANGSMHLGHMLEYTQTDIWVRFQRSSGHECYFAWADDAHGTPIMLSARKAGVSPEELIEKYNTEHRQDFDEFGISYDNFSSTHSKHNHALVESVYRRVKEAGYIETRTISQLYDTEEDMFLPDRFILGTCPKCGAEDQYGDGCEVCSKTYSPTDLVNPRSAVSGSTPELRDTDHVFFLLSRFEERLEAWTRSGALQEEVANKLAEWFTEGLRDWDITRDEPYFGIAIPDLDEKYFYVWVDAPFGYAASFRELAERLGLDFDQWWAAGSETELYHFIGKDIVYFHTLFWPAMLSASGMRIPTGVYAHGFLTVDGSKMSKSRGTFIKARTYLDHLQPDYLRYYYASKLGTGLADIDLNLEDFVQKVNSDLVGKVINIASRCAGFIGKRYDNKLAAELPDPDLYQQFVSARQEIGALFEGRNFQAAVRRIMALADDANRYVDEHKPWQMVKEEGSEQAVQAVCSQGINLFRVLMTYLSPVIPFTAAAAGDFLNADLTDWGSIDQPLENCEIKPFKPLMMRVDTDKVKAMVEDSKESLQSISPDDSEPLDLADEIDINAFKAVDLRIARIVRAEAVEGADKLLRLTLDIGGEQRNVFAGIKSAYDPADLEGRLTVMVANLKPRKMRFGISEGMVLAAGPGGDDLFILSPDDGAVPGMRVT